MPIQRSLARFRLAAIVFSTTFCALNVQAQSKSTSTPAAPVDKTIEVSPSKDWVDTGIDLHVGDTVTIAASALPGSLIGKLQKNASPIFVGANRQLKIAEAGHLYLGSNLSGPSNCAGEFSAQVRVTPTTNDAVSMKSKLASAAQIWLSGQLGRSNEQPNPNASAVSNPGSGSAVNTSAPGTAPLKALAVSKVPLDTSLGKQLETLPRRVSDEFKNPGDMANFVLIGSEKQVQD